MRVVLLGPPGAGKGTQAVRLADDLDVPHIATGDIFREHVRSSTDLGKQAKSYMDAGQLVPDDVVIGMVDERLGRDDAATGFLLDGFPRTVAQAAALDELLVEREQPLDAVLSFEVAHEELVGRIVGRRVCIGCDTVFHLEANPPAEGDVCDLCGGLLEQRPDDTEEVVRTRLAEYDEKTAPLVGHYEQQGLLRPVAADGDIEQVRDRALEALGRR